MCIRDRCKCRYQTQEELLSVAREYKRRGLPLSVIIIDFFHWPNQGVWDFDKTYWPDPKGMADELRAMGVKLFVSVWPTVDPRSPYYGEMIEKGYIVPVSYTHLYIYWVISLFSSSCWLKESVLRFVRNRF